MKRGHTKTDTEIIHSTFITPQLRQALWHFPSLSPLPQSEPHPFQRAPAESYFSITYPFTTNRLLRDQVGWLGGENGGGGDQVGC